MSDEVRFADLLALTTDGPESFLGPPAPERFGITYGGQFLAQALLAAAATVGEGKAPHSLHAYFVRAGDIDEATRYRVDEIREGRSFALRSVVATQQGTEVFRLTASFHHPEPGPTYHRSRGYPMADVPPPSDAQPDYHTFAAGHPDFDPDSWDGAQRPMTVRYINPPDPAGGSPVDEPQLMWLRLSSPLAADPAQDRAIHAAGLAYLSDGTLIDHALLPHGLRWFDGRLTGVSLDHAMWFHTPARADDWLLYDQRVTWTGGARGLVTGSLYDQLGVLVATCTQEGLIRLADGDGGGPGETGKGAS